MKANTCNDNSHSGIHFLTSDDNNLFDSVFRNNVVNAIGITGGSEYNDFHWNTFVGAVRNQGVVSDFVYNYYSDYDGSDDDGDGFGDIPYTIPWSRRVDNFPLVYEATAPTLVAPISDIALEFGQRLADEGRRAKDEYNEDYQKQKKHMQGKMKALEQLANG